jgi:hypothetical protein
MPLAFCAAAAQQRQLSSFSLLFALRRDYAGPAAAVNHRLGKSIHKHL